MKIDRRGTLVAGLGLLFLLTAFMLLISQRSSLVAPEPAKVISSSTITMTHNLTKSVTLSIPHGISTTQAITLSSWLTFTDLEAKYSLRYPPNSYINSGQSKGQTYRTLGIGFQIPNQRYQGMSVRVEPNPQNLPIDKFFSVLYQKINNNPLDLPASHMLEQIEFANMAAYKTKGLYGDIQILLPYKDKVYFFSLGYGIAGGASSPEAETIFFQILDTFQIIP